MGNSILDLTNLVSNRRTTRATSSVAEASPSPRGATINDLSNEVWDMISAAFAASLELEIKYKESSFAPDLNRFCITSKHDFDGNMPPHPLCYVSKRFCRSVLPQIWDLATFTINPGIFSGYGFAEYSSLPRALRQRIRNFLGYYSELSQFATVNVPYIDMIDTPFEIMMMRMTDFPHLKHLTIVGAAKIRPSENTVDRVEFDVDPDDIPLSHYVHYRKTFHVHLVLVLKREHGTPCTAYYDKRHGLRLAYDFGVPPNPSWKFRLEDLLKLCPRNARGLIEHLCNDGVVGARRIHFDWEDRARRKIAEEHLPLFEIAWKYHRSNENQMAYYPFPNPQ